MHLALTPSSLARCPDLIPERFASLTLTPGQGSSQSISWPSLTSVQPPPRAAAVVPLSSHRLLAHFPSIAQQPSISTFPYIAQPRRRRRCSSATTVPFEGSPPLLIVLVTRYLCLPLACSVEGFF
ncbi:uncharacterized protein DS421_3g87820 [Arachis hypogaea]|nr:uncharacterized protein DS421_3g87820 [Arachis hypogaea]